MVEGMGHNLLTHAAAWRDGLISLRNAAVDDADKTYWQHELDVLTKTLQDTYAEIQDYRKAAAINWPAQRATECRKVLDKYK